LTILIFAIYVLAGAFTGPLTRFLLPVTWIALAAMLVESLPFKDIDNLTITLTSILVSYFVF
jgi:dolichol kinase